MAEGDPKSRLGQGSGGHDEDAVPSEDGSGFADQLRDSQVRNALRLDAATHVGEESGEHLSPLAPPEPDRVLYTVVDLARAVSVEMHDEEIVHGYVEALGRLFPRRLFAVRLIEPDTGRLSLVHATGRLRPERRLAVKISREALDRHGIPPDAASGPHLVASDAYEPVFDPHARGFDVPLMDGGRMVGALAVEYPPGRPEVTGDRTVVVQIALQLGAALRNARLLRESRYLRDYLGQLLEHANAPIVVIGRHREVRVVNRAFLALTGMRRNETLGEDFLKLLPSEERQRLVPVFIDALRGRSTTNFELRVPRSEGGFARLSMNTASILSSVGDVEAVIAIGRDLTELRQLEEQVVQAEKLATLGQLAAGVVHELNNPLTSISVYSDYLLKRHESTGGDEGDVEKLRRIMQSAERILRFTRDLVTYARPSGEQPRLTCIHEVLDQSVVFCEHVIQENGATIEKSYTEELSPIYAIEAQLHQVFINLITNACHAMPEAAGHLRIETGAVDDERLFVKIRDNGRGIPPDHADRVFEPFFSTKGEGKGTGLGLSIVRNLVQQHNGTIDVDSHVGDGTTFTVTFPCRPTRRA